MKRQLLSVISLGLAAAASAQVYVTEQMSMPVVTGVTNEGIAVGYAAQASPYYIWNPKEGTFKEIGGFSPGSGIGGTGRISQDGIIVSAAMFCDDIPLSNEWVRSTVQEMAGIAFSRIVCVSGNYLYAIGSNADGTAGAILRSNNSGTTWQRYDNIQRVNEAGEQELVRPDFGVTCFGALTHRSLIVGTTDGQLLSDRMGTWSPKTLSGVESEMPVKAYVAMDFTYEVINTAGAEKAVTGCIAAILEDGSGIVWYTDDGASTFHPSETAIPDTPVSIANNGTEFFMTTSEGKILISEDAGKTWTENFTVPEGAAATRIAFADAAKGVALAGNTLYFTGDGGKTWTPATVPGAESAVWKDAAWNGEQLVVVGIDGACFMSNDSGNTFKKQEGFEGDLGAVGYKGSEKVYNVLGTGGEAYRLTARDKVSGYTAGVYDVESETWTPLRSTGYLEGQTLSSPYDMSPDGRYIVGNIRDLDKEAGKVSAYACVWEGVDKLTVLPNMFASEGKNCRANAVSYDGSVVAGWQDKWGPWFASLWTRDAEGNYSQRLLAVKDDYNPETFDFSDMDACIQTFPGDCQTVSLDGKWVGGAGEGWSAITGAWIWSEETGFKKLTGEDVTTATVSLIANDGSWAMGWQGDSSHPWAWTEEDGLQSLQDYLTGTLGIDTKGIQIMSPYGMSPNGRYICGLGNRDGQAVGYVIDLKAPVGIDEVSLEQVKASVYPNPVAEELHVDLPFDSDEVRAEICLVDLHGRLVAGLTAPARSNVIDVRGLAKGVYVLDVRSYNTHKSFKVVVR